MAEQWECGLCGRDLEEAKAPAGCGTCKGSLTVPIQEKSYTLSEVRAGKAPKDSRYSRGDNPYSENVGPRIVTNLPGSSAEGS